MQPLGARDIVDVWELGTGSALVDKGLLLLAAAHPGVQYDVLAGLSLGRRNAALFALRQAMFGPGVEARTECPACGERLEFGFDQRDLAPEDAGTEAGAVLRLCAAGHEIEFRPPTGDDLAAAALAPDLAGARKALLCRIVTGAWLYGAPVLPEALPDAAVAALEERVAEADPGADPVLALDCAACGHAWSAAFDIAGFLWSEVAVLGRRLLDEVDILARAYGWSEAEILALGAARRRHYLERAAG